MQTRTISLDIARSSVNAAHLHLPGLRVEKVKDDTIFRVSKMGIEILFSKETLHFSSAFALNQFYRSFIATPLTLLPMSVAALQIAMVAVAMHAIILGIFHIYKSNHSGFCTSDKNSLGLGSSAKELANLSYIHFAGMSGPNILIHEMGHAISASACFKNAKSAITIVPFSRGSTEYVVSNGLTTIGKLFGKEGSKLLCKAAGPLASLTFAMSELAIAHFNKRENPKIAKAMELHSVSQIVPEVIYASMAYYRNPGLGSGGHIMNAFPGQKNILADDFLALWIVGGIHPLVFAGLMALLPVVEKVWLNHWYPKQS